jgi:hypothetical protein
MPSFNVLGSVEPVDPEAANEVRAEAPLALVMNASPKAPMLTVTYLFTLYAHVCHIRHSITP